MEFGRHTIDVNGNKIYSQFIHLSSFSEKDKNFYIPRPCIKLNYHNICKNCIERTYTLKHNSEERAICIYRMSLLKLFKNIFYNINNDKMENIDNPSDLLPQKQLSSPVHPDHCTGHGSECGKDRQATQKIHCILIAGYTGQTF